MNKNLLVDYIQLVDSVTKYENLLKNLYTFAHSALIDVLVYDNLIVLKKNCDIETNIAFVHNELG